MYELHCANRYLDTLSFILDNNSKENVQSFTSSVDDGVDY